MRIILDTNVLVSAALSGSSIPGKVFDEVLEEHIILASKESCTELEEVIWRKKFDSYITPDERRFFLNVFINEAQIVGTKEKITACRDPKDNMLLELAVSGQADYIITGDRDLLALNPFQIIPHLTREFS